MPLKYERGDLAAKNIKSKYTATVARVSNWPKVSIKSINVVHKNLMDLLFDQ